MGTAAALLIFVEFRFVFHFWGSGFTAVVKTKNCSLKVRFVLPRISEQGLGLCHFTNRCLYLFYLRKTRGTQLLLGT